MTAEGGRRLTLRWNKICFRLCFCVHMSVHTEISLVGPFIHLVVCLTTGPKPLPKLALHIVRSSASSFNWGCPLHSLRSSSSFLCLLPRLPVTSIPPFIFPSITCFRRQFLRKMWPIRLAFSLLISCRIFLCSLTPSNTFSFLTWSVQLIFSILLRLSVKKIMGLVTVNIYIYSFSTKYIRWFSPYRHCPSSCPVTGSDQTQAVWHKNTSQP